ncbi:hypothetical protein P355_3761 [Burkholderia cenocepacia KC-01]|nr:hypothetical protein P355_3761 [Burkholderia cenocepacia KC-01]
MAVAADDTSTSVQNMLSLKIHRGGARAKPRAGIRCGCA